jgi:PAS domain S-box-containing protein
MNYQAIIPSLRQWLTPPVFADKEQSRAARWLNLLSLTLVVLIVIDSIAILTGLLDQSATWQIMMTNGIGLVISLVTIWFMRRGHVKIAAVILLTTVYALITYVNAIVFQSIHTFNVIAYFVIIPLVGLILGRKSMNILGVLCITTISTIFYFEWLGVLTPSAPRSPFDNVVILFFAIGLNTILLNASILRVEEQADEIHQTAMTLVSINQELQQSQVQLQQARTQLEQKVQQRTQELQESNRKLQKEVEERQHLLDALAASEANWRSIAEYIPDTIARINPDYTIAFINRAIGGKMPEEWIGASIMTLHQQPEQQRLLRERIQTVFQTGQTISYEIEEKQEEQRTWQINRVGPIWQNSKIVALILIATDITEQKQTEDAMYQMQKLESLGILAGGVAHDFNNLLSVMIMQLSLSMTKLSPAHPVESNLARALKAAERATELTQQMLNYAGRSPTETKQLNLNDLILDNIHLFSASISKNIRLTAEPSSIVPLMLGDKGQLQQLIMNLIINSADAIGGKSGEIQVVTKICTLTEEVVAQGAWVGVPLTPGSYVQLAVHDTGCGMDAQTLRKIFDPFFTTKFTGRGLGLASVIGIVRAHKGALQVNSVVDQGTTFTILFPMLTAGLPIANESTPTSFAGAGELVLVIDDEEPVCASMAAVLQEGGLRVLTATDGATVSLH